MKPFDSFALAWLALANFATFLLFGIDKWKSGKGRRRIPEFHLVLAGALGGWPGGLVAMLLFRHKTAKLSFLLKYAAGFLIFAGLTYACLSFR